MDELREHLADLAHDQWVGWMRYLFSKCRELLDGSLVIPPDCVAHWARQMASEYRALPEIEKDSDRFEADKMIERFRYAAQHTSVRPISGEGETKMENFTREELAELRSRARALAEVEGTNPHWVSAYWELANAADRLDAMIARTVVVVVKQEAA